MGNNDPSQPSQAVSQTDKPDHSLRRQVGAIHAIRQTGTMRLAWPEGIVALALGGGGAATLVGIGSVDESIQVAGALLTVAIALIAVTFAAFAILIAYLSDQYMLLLDRASSKGFPAFLQPFMVAVTIQSMVIVIALGYQAFARHLPLWPQRVTFVVLGTLAIYAVVDVIAISRELSMHALTRLRHLQSTERREQASADAAREEVQPTE